MTVIDRKPRAKTFLPDELTQEQVEDFLRHLDRFADKQTRLISGDGEEVLLPEALFDVLKRVATELAARRGVTIVPQETKMTTQQAADYLGISRPTLVRLLTDEKIPYERVGRHRRITFRDLYQYREQAGAERRALLRQMAREGQQAGLHEVSGRDMPPRQ